VAEVIIGGIIERDIDFLLMEELSASPSFLSWFASQAGLAGAPTLRSVQHSSTSATGETDIEIRLGFDTENVFLLLENKVDAPLQPRQAERYRERARRYVKEGACGTCLTGLVAPSKYLGDDPTDLGFDFTLRYEEILGWFDRASSQGDQHLLERALLRRALDRGAVGWTLVPHEGVTEFWRRYWDLARALAPELQMPKPAIKPATSAFVFFRPAGFPRGIKLIHKVPYAHVDIQFDGMASQITRLTRRYGPHLQHGMALEKASKSAVVRIQVPSIDMTAPFQESEPAVREGIWAAKLLFVWFRGLPSTLRAA
jgi:hypothetical protein